MTSALRSVASECGLGQGSAIAWPLPSGVHEVDAVCTSHGFVAQSQMPALYGETCTSYEAAPGTGSHETIGVSSRRPWRPGPVEHGVCRVAHAEVRDGGDASVVRDREGLRIAVHVGVHGRRAGVDARRVVRRDTPVVLLRGRQERHRCQRRGDGLAGAAHVRAAREVRVHVDVDLVVRGSGDRGPRELRVEHLGAPVEVVQRQGRVVRPGVRERVDVRRRAVVVLCIDRRDAPVVGAVRQPVGERVGAGRGRHRHPVHRGRQVGRRRHGQAVLLRPGHGRPVQEERLRVDDAGAVGGRLRRGRIGPVDGEAAHRRPRALGAGRGDGGDPQV